MRREVVQVWSTEGRGCSPCRSRSDIPTRSKVHNIILLRKPQQGKSALIRREIRKKPKDILGIQLPPDKRPGDVDPALHIFREDGAVDHRRLDFVPRVEEGVQEAGLERIELVVGPGFGGADGYFLPACKGV